MPSEARFVSLQPADTAHKHWVNPKKKSAASAAIQSIRPQLLTPEEAARLCAVSVRTLEGWRRRQSGPPFIRLGNTVRYDMGELLAFLAEHTVRGAA